MLGNISRGLIGYTNVIRDSIILVELNVLLHI